MQLREEIQVKSAVVPVGSQNFEAVVLKAELPVIVDFSADWCPPCRVLAPLYANLSQEYTDKVRFASLDIDEHPAIAARYGVQGAPTLIIFHQGKEVTRLVGPHPGRLRATIARELAQYNLS